MNRTLTYDSDGNDITCIKEYTALKYPCRECGRADCVNNENYISRTMNLSDIIIKKAFMENTPNDAKMDKCRRYWDEYHKIDRNIVISPKNELVDGYIGYLVLKDNGVKETEVKILSNKHKHLQEKRTKGRKTAPYRNETTTYVYGIHPNSSCNKQFIWRVPKNWKWFAENVQVGDSILCRTKFGISPVIVTKIEVLDKCPVDFEVKKVVGKYIKRGQGLTLKELKEKAPVTAFSISGA